MSFDIYIVASWGSLQTINPYHLYGPRRSDPLFSTTGKIDASDQKKFIFGIVFSGELYV